MCPFIHRRKLCISSVGLCFSEYFLCKEKKKELPVWAHIFSAKNNWKLSCRIISLNNVWNKTQNRSQVRTLSDGNFYICVEKTHQSFIPHSVCFPQSHITFPLKCALQSGTDHYCQMSFVWVTRSIKMSLRYKPLCLRPSETSAVHTPPV